MNKCETEIVVVTAALACEYDHEMFLAAAAGTKRDRERHENTAAGVRTSLAIMLSARKDNRVNAYNSRDYKAADAAIAQYRPYPPLPGAPASAQSAG